MRTRRRHMLALVAAVGLLAAACGDDPADVGAGSGGEGSSPESTLPRSDGAPTGTGELTVAGESYAFEADVCSLTPVNHGARDYQLYVHGSAPDGADDYEVEVFRATSESGNTIETIRLHTGEGELIAATNVAGEDSDGNRLEVSSSLLSGEMAFTGTDDVAVGTGTLDVACG